MKILKKLIIVSSLIFLIACGGGGGGGSEIPGVWRTSNFLVLNTCGTNDPDTVDLILNVNQDGDNVVVDVGGGDTFAGQILDNGFNFVRARNVDGCIVTTLGEVTDIDGDFAESSLRIGFDCPGFAPCEISYVGQAERL